jgi:thymidylate synthase
MNKADFYYTRNLENIIKYGQWDENPRPKWKDGTPAHSKFITQVFEEYNIDKGEFPITTLRNTAIKMGIKEMLWIYQQQSNKLSDAHNLGIKWWDEWNIGDDTIGQRYGATVKEYDLMNRLLSDLKDNPYSRRHIINMYQESDLRSSKGLFPCAYETLWSIRKVNDDFYIDMTLIQRSNDYVMAGYINKIQYVALMMMVAGYLGYKLGKFCHLTQNLHVYDRHFDAVTEILTRKPLSGIPKISLKENKNFYDYTIDDFIIDGTEGIQKLSTKLEIAV